MRGSAAEIVREYRFPGVDHVHGVTYDGQHVWFGAGDRLHVINLHAALGARRRGHGQQ